MYVDMITKYRLRDIEIDWVKSERGAGQGCMLSSTIFSLYTEELAAGMRRMKAGVRVGNGKICILYADDVVVMIESADELKDVLVVVEETLELGLVMRKGR